MTEFIHPLRVRHNECDPQGIVFNANFLMYVDVALAEMWASLFGSYENAVSTYGVDTVVGSATLDFRAPASPGDDLGIGLAIDTIGTTSITYAIHIRRGETTVATGSIRYVCIDPTAKSKAPVPDGLRTALLAA